MLLASWFALAWGAEVRARNTAERRTDELAAQLERLRGARGRAQQERDEARARLARLERRFLRTEQLRGRTADTVAQLERQLEQAREHKRQDKKRHDAAPVRAAELTKIRATTELLRRLNYILRTSGGDHLRVHEIGRRDGKLLHDVRILSIGEEAVPNGLYVADTCEIELDRARGVVGLVMKGVTRVLGGVHLPRLDSERLEFEASDPHRFELELADLVKPIGSYPKPRVIPAPKANELLELALWRDRLSAFMDYVAGDDEFEVHRLGRVRAGAFESVEFLGYTAHGVWNKRLKAAKLEVWCDLDTDHVELRLYDGFLETSMGRIRFPKERCYRHPLPGILRNKTEKFLTGYVHHFHSTADAAAK